MTAARKQPGDGAASSEIAAGDQAALSAAQAQDAAWILPLAGIVLLMPPVIGLFTTSIVIFGVPLILAYMFIVWGALVWAAWLLTRRLSRPGGAYGEGEGEG